ncbi:MAG: phosphoribosylglycinamide formyltransferase, partial [Candidatus Limnocylindrales bacterium]
MTEVGARIAVGVSGQGSNLRALRAAERRGMLGGSIVSVFADRVCPALDWAVEQGIPVLLVPPSGHADAASWDIGLAAGLQQV